MFNLYIKPSIIQDSTQTQGKLTLKQIPQIRHKIANQSLNSFNTISTVPLCVVQNKPVSKSMLVLDKFQTNLNKQYSQLRAKLRDSQKLKGAHILMSKHLRLSRDVLASKATRLQKLQSGFIYMVASSRRLEDQYKQQVKGKSN